MKTKVEGPRGCGHRKPGGLYLITDGAQWRDCGKLPLPLACCPTCSAGVKFSRGWTWIEPAKLFTEPCRKATLDANNDPVDGVACLTCAIGSHGPAFSGRHGLIWVGESFYSTDEWLDEARLFGVSRRIKSVPRGFELGKTWVFTAHVKGAACQACRGDFVFCSECNGSRRGPGVFQVFKPTAVEYVVKGDETPEEIEALEKRGIDPVQVIPCSSWPTTREVSHA